DIAAALYSFEADPRQCRGADGGHFQLRDILVRHGADTVIVVSDGAPFIDPLNGRVRPWAVELTDLRYAVLLTPLPLHRWSRREKVLADAGFIVLPSTPAGLLSLSDLLQRGAEGPRRAVEAHRPVRPSLIARIGKSELSWHQDTPVPPDEERAALIDALTTDLRKPAFDLLCALALFPAVRLDLTLHLGMGLKQRDGQPLLDEANFGAIAWLPWLRFGRMPDWLRRDLVRCLSPAMLAEARAIYRQWLVTSEDTAAGAVLDLSPEQRNMITRWLRRSAASDAASPLRDVIFLRFMEGKSLDDLDLETPELHRMLASRWLEPGNCSRCWRVLSIQATAKDPATRWRMAVQAD
ncbi:MAG: hypothetical protein K0Q71_6026, partial [Thermomicrobiales bacterium]|nr:hypothetical protein [Thermomicrobiales bacterium]